MKPEEMAVAIGLPIILPLLLLGLSRAGALAAVQIGELRYARTFRWFGLLFLLIPTLGLLTIFIFLSEPLDRSGFVSFLSLLVFFLAGGLAMVLEFFRVRHRYDDTGLSFRSPWSRHRHLAWTDVQSIKWRRFMKSLDIETVSGATARMSPWLSGLKPFADVALARLPSVVLSSCPQARVVLQLMSAGAAGTLMTDERSPEQILAAVTARPGGPNARNA